MHHTLRLTLLLPLLCLSVIANATPRESLLKAEIGGYQVSTAFSAYIYFEGGPKFKKQLHQAINLENEHITELTNFTNVQQQWQAAANFLRDNETDAADGTDRRLDTALAVHMNELYRLIRAELANQPEGISSDYLATRLQFEKVIAQYIGYTSTSMGVYHSDETIDESVAKFSTMLENIRNKNADYQTLLNKWNFIKKGMIAGTSAPFVTLHTAQKIRQLLAKVYGEKLS